MKERPEEERPNREELREELYQRFSPWGLWKRRLRWVSRRLTWLVAVQLLTGAKRLVDLLLALALLAALSPVLVLLWAVNRSRGRRTERIPRIGLWGRTFSEYRFPLGGAWAKLGLTRLPVLLNILRGDLSFVGPRAVSPGEMSPRERALWRRYNVRPGVFCLWWIRQRANIAYTTEAEADAEYADTMSVRGDLGILLRAIPAMLYGEGVAVAPDRVTLLGIDIDNLTMEEAVEAVLEAAGSGRPVQVCFVNADCANIAWKNREYLEVLRTADLVFADGIGMKLAGKLLGNEIKQNVNGTDLFPRLCEAAAEAGRRIYLLGARPGVAEAVRDWAERRAPGVIAGVQHGYFSEDEEPGVIESVTAAGPDIVLVAFGAPRQDQWLRSRRDALGPRVTMGVGGLFDFYSGRIPRAPQWMREMGMEWFYRFLREPRRMWRRYFVGNFVFLWHVIAERLHARSLGA